MLVFRKILRTYLMDSSSWCSKIFIFWKHEIKLELFLNSIIKFYIMLTCQSFYSLYYALNKEPKKFYIRGNNKVDFIETGHTVILHLLPWSDLERCIYSTLFLINDDKILLSQRKVAPRVEKTEVFRKSWNFANRTYFASCIIRKHFFFYYGQKKQRFFLIFTMELFSTALGYFIAQSTLNFTRTSLYF